MLGARPIARPISRWVAWKSCAHASLSAISRHGAPASTAALAPLSTSAFVVPYKTVRGAGGGAEAAEDFGWHVVAFSCTGHWDLDTFGSTCTRCKTQAAGSLMPACLAERNTRSRNSANLSGVRSAGSVTPREPRHLWRRCSPFMGWAVRNSSTSWATVGPSREGSPSLGPPLMTLPSVRRVELPNEHI